MAEWWNLDQALIWITERDATAVARASGDAEGAKVRQAYYLDFLDAGDEKLPSDPFCNVRMSDLTGLLGTDVNKIHARNALDDAAAYPLDVPFISYDCVVADIDRSKGPHLTLRSTAFPYRWLCVVVDANSVLRLFPSKAPDSMQEELANLHERLSTHPTPSPLGEGALLPEPLASSDAASRLPHEVAAPEASPMNSRGRKTALALQAIAEDFPHGLPDPMQKAGDKQAAFRALKKKIEKANPGTSISIDAIRKAADLLKKSGR